MAQAAKPDLLNRALARLTPEFIAAIEPLYDNFHRSPDRDFSVYLQKHGDAVRAALLGIADAHATASRHATLRAVYQQLRGFADEELRLFTPALGRLICGYL